MKKCWLILLLFFLVACGKETSVKGREYIYSTPNGFQITLGFDKTGDRYFGKGVNKYYGRYTLNENQLSFGIPTSTMMMGDSFDMTEEEKFLNLLAEIQSFEVDNEQLTLITKENKRFVLKQKKYTYSKEAQHEE